MEHDLAPEIFQLFGVNLVTPRVLPQECYRIPEGRSSPTIDCDSRLDLEDFRYNLAVPELIRGALGPCYVAQYV